MDRRGREAAGGGGRKAAGGGGHQCPNCLESFENQEVCEIHVFTEHSDQHQVHVPRYAHVCPDCGASFQHLDELQEHSLMLHSENYADITDMQDDREGVPSRTFEQRFDVGPRANQFAPFAPAKVKAMLNGRLKQHIVKPTHLPVPRCDKDILGQHRGVAGHSNSCYFDCAMMFLAFFTQFDGIYSQEALDQSELLRIILFEVVIPLRTTMFVSRDVIAMLRYCLANQTGNQNYLGSIMDFDEFINDLMQTIDTRTVCVIRHDGSMDAKLTFPISADKPFGSLQAGLDDCLRAKKVTFEQPPSAFFVRVRPAFRVRPLALPQMGLNVFGELYNLSAILCIEAAHYMCFLRFPNGEWVFFDSMQGFDNGHRIPTMTRVPKFEDYIGSGCDERLLPVKSYGREGEIKHSFHDLVTEYAYTFLYTRNTDSAQDRQLYQANAPQLAAAGGGAAGGGAAAVSRQHPQQKPSAGGGAAAVSAKPAQSFRKSSASGGGAAAISCHQSLSSFGHTQSSRITTFDGSIFPIMDHDGAFYDVMTTCLLQSGCPNICKVTELSWVLEDLCEHDVQIFGSFRVKKGSVNYRYRVTSVRFDDNSEVKLLRSIDEFVYAIDAKWQQSFITSVTLEECSE